MSDPFVFAGAVLAGGRASRFGSDKCAHGYRGKTLLDHALRSLDGAQERYVVGGSRRVPSGATWLPDEHPGEGPLAGLQVALKAAKQPWLALLGCDMPFVPLTLWPLLASCREGVRMVVPEGPSGLEPMAALYHRELLPLLDERLRAGGGSLRDLHLEAPVRVVPWSQLRHGIAPMTFLNANRPEDLP